MGVRDWERAIPLLSGSVDFWLSVSKRRGAGQAFQPCGDKEALSTAVILWRRSGNTAGPLLHTGLQEPHYGPLTLLDHNTPEGTGSCVCGYILYVKCPEITSIMI